MSPHHYRKSVRLDVIDSRLSRPVLLSAWPSTDLRGVWVSRLIYYLAVKVDRW